MPPPTTIDIAAARDLSGAIHRHMHAALANKSLKHKCFSKLNIQSQEFFEFSDHSVLSNLYWGVENAEAALDSHSYEERESRLDASEKMLQIPASLDGNGATLGIPNAYLLCSSFLYLAAVEFTRAHQWRGAAHFLQAVSICPRIVCRELAPGIWRELVPLFVKAMGLSVPLDEFDDGMIDDAMRWIAGRYKPWLMYYQIMSAADSCRTDALSTPLSGVQKSCEQRNGVRANNPNRPNTRQESISNDVQEELHIVSCAPTLERRRSMEAQARSNPNTKCLKDVLTESQPDTPKSSISDNLSSVDETFSESCGEDAEEEYLNRIGTLSWNARTSIGKKRRGSLNIDRTNMECIHRSFSTSGLKSTYQYAPHHGVWRRAKSLSSRATQQLEETEQNGVVERIISKLCFTEELGKTEVDYTVEINTIYQALNTKTGLKYSLLKDMILDQLIISISTSKEDMVVRTSLAILSTIITSNTSAVDDIKRKGLHLHDLAAALKRRMHEAAILIYLINPPPAEVRTLELLPCLVEVVCTASTSHRVGRSPLPPPH